MEYCQFAIGTYLAESPETVRSVIDRALAACGNHVVYGSQIWEVAREFEMALLSVELSKVSLCFSTEYHFFYLLYSLVLNQRK